MKIEVWADFACPSCYVGKKTLEMAIDKFGKDKYIEIEYKSFQLDPNAKQTSTDKLLEVLQQRYQLSKDKLDKMEQQITEQAKDIGIALKINDLLYTDTYDAHRLVKFAEKFGKEYDVMEQLYQTYFINQENIGSKAVLLAIAKEIGLDDNEVDSLLSFNKYARAVVEDQEIAHAMGIQDIPFFIFHDRYAVSGAQPLSVYLNILHEMWEEDKDCFQLKQSTVGDCCIGNECEEK